MRLAFYCVHCFFRFFLILSSMVGRFLNGIVRAYPADTDIVFVIPASARGWILDAISKEIAQYYSGNVRFHYSIFFLPRAKAYFFAYYGMVPDALKFNPQIRSARLSTWYTHPKDQGYSETELVYALNLLSKVFVTCSLFAEDLIARGVGCERVEVVLGAADPELFSGHQRGNGAVGFCSAFYERKDPERILNIVRAMPHRRFLLVGRNWNQYTRFAEMQTLKNFRYVEAEYVEYPRFYAEMDVFVSVSKLEGGPIPLIEAMMSNCVPVASLTGFSRDVIIHGENGYLFPIDAPEAEICSLIDQAYSTTSNVRKTVEHLDWRSFSGKITASLLTQ